MASSSDTANSPPPTENYPSLPFNLDQEPKVREWSQYELDTVLSLICKYEHLASQKEKGKKQRSPHAKRRGGRQSEDDVSDWAFSFATKLNEALHGMHNYKDDIPLADVRELVDFIEIKNKAVMDYIKRQSTPFRVTRAKKFAFLRLCNTFNKTFYKWTLLRRQRRRNPSISAEEEMTRGSWIDYYLSKQDRENYLLGAARIEKNAHPSENTERGWISNTVYARRSRDIDLTPSSSQDHKAFPSQQSGFPTGQDRPFRFRKRHRSIHPPPPPPLPPPFYTGSLIEDKYMGNQPSDIYDKGYFKSMETVTHADPARRTSYEDFDQNPLPACLPPTSPAYFGHAGLRQSIHPTGPRLETPLLTYEGDSDPERSGSSGAHMLLAHSDSYGARGYEYPEPPDEKASYDYNTVYETPCSPCSPMYTSGCMVATDGGEKSPLHTDFDTGEGLLDY
ncbi:hypothetical protein F5B22DRAFT_648501 [Xylaria bambusicola]|uniref:uncharacterized protein n=1 Tax=Xylaria bambusicola TaxID=326684 RepID=UPI002007440E|nr:uncharacterized protein F5B22DRAFT_648501 [Xylaria bambusicola]KAI0512651.1 hypothetical protein F5B22DRAFT_648501 [Xylaria bambusicola]